VILGPSVGPADPRLVVPPGPSVDVESKLGLSLPFETNRNADSGIPNLKLADFGLKLGESVKWTQIHDNVIGNTTYTTGGEVFDQKAGNVGPIGGELKKILGSSIAMTRDKDKNIVKIALVRQDRVRGRGQTGRRFRHRCQLGDNRLTGGRRYLPWRAGRERHSGAGRFP
jgi:hypothetical protein